MPGTVIDKQSHDKQTHPSSSEMNLDLLNTVFLFLDLGTDRVAKCPGAVWE